MIRFGSPSAVRSLLPLQWRGGGTVCQTPDIQTLELGILLRGKPGHENPMERATRGRLRPDDLSVDLQTDSADVTPDLDRCSPRDVRVQVKPASLRGQIAQGPSEADLLILRCSLDGVMR